MGTEPEVKMSKFILRTKIIWRGTGALLNYRECAKACKECSNLKYGIEILVFPGTNKLKLRGIRYSTKVAFDYRENSAMNKNVRKMQVTLQIFQKHLDEKPSKGVWPCWTYVVKRLINKIYDGRVKSTRK